MAKDRKKLVHIHSKITDKQPRPEALEVGEIAVNNGVSGNTDRSFLSIKNADNKVVRFSSDEQMIFWTEKKEVIPFEGQVRGEDGPESTKDSGDYGSYGITNDDLLNNKSNLVIKFNQVAASNTPKSEVINGGKDIYGKLVNGTPDASREGAGIAIDMSRYAMRGANPSFSSLTITNGTTLEGDLNVSGNTNIGNGLNVTGATNINGATKITGDTTFNGNETVNGNLTVTGNTNVSGNTTINGNTNISGDTNVGNNLKVTNGITADTVSATTSIKSPIISGTDITASNSVKADNVSANTITASTSVTTKDLNVSGNAKITGTTDIAGATTINNALTVNGETLLKNTTVDGSLLVNSGATIHNGISVDGGVDITGATNINGETKITGDTIINGDETVNGELAVTGNSSLNAVSASSISASTIISPTANLSAITSNSITNSGNITTNTLNATAVTANNATITSLTATSENVTNLTASTISGGSAIIGGELSVSGDTTLKNVTASTISASSISASSIETKSGLTHKITFSSGYTPSITNPVFNASADTQVTIPTVGGYPDKAEYNSTDKKIYFKHDNTTLPSMTIDATDFIKDGMVDDAKVENGYLVITFNTDSGKEDIKIPLTDIFNPSNYYTKTDLTATTNYATVRKAYSADTASTIALAGVTNADDLKAIEALTGTSGLLKKTAANTWTLDTTSYSSATQVNTALAGKVPTGRTITTASGLTGGGNLSTDRTIGLSATGTAGTYGPTADVTGTEGTTIKIPQITTDAYGRVTSVTERTLTNKNSTYTVNNGTFAISGNGTSVASTSANASANSGLNIKSGSNVTITTGTNEITIAATDTKYTEGRAIDITNNVVSLDLPISAGTGASSIIEGNGTKASGVQSHAEGYCTSATSNASHAEGSATLTSGIASHAEGSGTKTLGQYSHAEGYITTASGDSSHAEGWGTTASGWYSHAEGASTTASGYYSHAEGYSTTASGTSPHAEGSSTKAIGWYSHAEGNSTTASGSESHAEGNSTKAIGNASHAEGYSTVTNNQSEHASGMYNISRTGSTDSAKTLFTVGNGTYQTPHNAFEIRQNGDTYVNGNVTANAFYATSDERLKENIENVSYAKIANAANVNIKSFNFKSDEEKKTVIGVIAQDVEKENLGFIVSTSDDGMKAVDYTGLSLLKIAYLEQKIKELENIINELKQNKQ